MGVRPGPSGAGDLVRTSSESTQCHPISFPRIRSGAFLLLHLLVEGCGDTRFTHDSLAIVTVSGVPSYAHEGRSTTCTELIGSVW